MRSTEYTAQNHRSSPRIRVIRSLQGQAMAIGRLDHGDLRGFLTEAAPIMTEGMQLVVWDSRYQRNSQVVAFIPVRGD